MIADEDQLGPTRMGPTDDRKQSDVCRPHLDTSCEKRIPLTPLVRVFGHGAMLIGRLSPRSVRHQPCGTAAADVAKSRWHAGSPREAD